MSLEFGHKNKALEGLCGISCLNVDLALFIFIFPLVSPVTFVNFPFLLL
jgi:hypothetical protein